MAVFAEYPGTLALDVAAPLANGSSLTAQSNIITTMQAGDLILGYGWNSTTNYDSIAPSAGFTLESFPHNAHLEDQTQAIAGPISSGVLWSGAVNWTQGIVALKVSNQPLVWVMPGLGTATFPMNIPPACSPTDGTCSIQIQVCDTSKTPPVCMTSSQGTITLLKNVTLPTPQQQSIPLVTVTP
jgi:hypothetical protein